jgi:hypothetical protein
LMTSTNHEALRHAVYSSLPSLPPS